MQYVSMSTPTRELCRWCKTYHPSKCPLVKALEYHPDGTLKRVEFHDRHPPLAAIEPPTVTNPWELPRSSTANSKYTIRASAGTATPSIY